MMMMQLCNAHQRTKTNMAVAKKKTKKQPLSLLPGNTNVMLSSSVLNQ